jgi:hypothetical protein
MVSDLNTIFIEERYSLEEELSKKAVGNNRESRERGYDQDIDKNEFFKINYTNINPIYDIIKYFDPTQ